MNELDVDENTMSKIIYVKGAFKVIHSPLIPSYYFTVEINMSSQQGQIKESTNSLLKTVLCFPRHFMLSLSRWPLSQTVNNKNAFNLSTRPV